MVKSVDRYRLMKIGDWRGKFATDPEGRSKGLKVKQHKIQHHFFGKLKQIHKTNGSS